MYRAANSSKMDWVRGVRPQLLPKSQDERRRPSPLYARIDAPPRGRALTTLCR